MNRVTGSYIRDEFPALTGIRAVAATMVFIDHFNFFKARWFGAPLHDFVREFHVGVTIFFVLSGFLICYRYAETFQPGSKWNYRYFVNRFARIYPMYFLFTLMAFWPGWCRQFCSFKIFLLNITFLRGFSDDYKFSGVATGWSLTVEEMFYFIFPLIIIFSKKLKIYLQPLVFLALGVLLWALFRNIEPGGFFRSLTFVFEYTFFGRCFEFYLGMMLAFYVKSATRVPGLVKGIPGRTTGGLLFMAICIALLAVNRRISQDPGQFLAFETLLNNFILPFGIVLFILGLLVEGSWIRNILSTPLLSLLGRSSYIFYLTHNGILFYLYHYVFGWRVPLVYVALQCSSILLYLFLERPMNLGIRKLAYGEWRSFRKVQSE
jgi:peptidoglycan/LPS O-acetylase OafA/YrhL